MSGPPKMQPRHAAATGLAHVIVALVMLAAAPLRAQTLGAVLAEHGVTAPADARDVDRQITSWAVLDDSFAPTHPVELWLYDPRAGQRRIYPEPPHGAVRAAYIADTAKRYRELGEAWFRNHNHHMDPERFDSSLIGPMIANSAGDALAFIARFGSDTGSPAAIPSVDVVVHCTGIRSTPVCTDVRLEEVRAQNPGTPDHELLVRRLGGG